MSRKTNFEDVSFWQQRYKKTICQWYEWLYSTNQILPYIKQFLPEQKQARILQLGCGSSTMGDRLASMGYKNITCIDFSKELIKNRQKTNKSCVKYLCHNMLDRFEFEDKFDLIIEKNSLDCLFCFADYPKKLLICMSQCFRLLSDNGKLISISHGKPKLRKYFYRNKFSPFDLQQIAVQKQECKNIKMKKEEISGDNRNYIYICSKNNGQNEENKSQNKGNLQIGQEHENEQEDEQNNAEGNNSQKEQDNNQQNDQNNSQKSQNQQDESASKQQSNQQFQSKQQSQNQDNQYQSESNQQEVDQNDIQ